MTAHSKPARLAAAALRAAIDQKWATATHYIQRINDECDDDGLVVAIVAWCDYQIRHGSGGDWEFSPGVNLDTWELETGGWNIELPPRVRWARRLVTARARGSVDEFQAAMDELNELPDPAERGRYVGGLVESAGLAIRNLPYGYARMGRAS